MEGSHKAVLPLEDYKRYGRQMILDGFGLPGKSPEPGRWKWETKGDRMLTTPTMQGKSNCRRHQWQSSEQEVWVAPRFPISLLLV